MKRKGLSSTSSERVWDAFRQRWVTPEEDVAEEDVAEEDDDEQIWVPLKQRRAGPKKEDDKRREVKTLVAEAAELQRDRLREEEERLVQEASRAQTNALQTAQEISNSTERAPVRTKWEPSRKARRTSPAEALGVRKKWGIIVDGEDPPAPIKRFGDMGLPEKLVRALAAKKIKRPTPIQAQGMPVALSGRDMIGIAFTGSGKTVTFTIPLVVRAMEREEEAAFGPGDGPVGLILCPSRELAKQTYDVVKYYVDAINSGGSIIRAVCVVGGEDKRSQLSHNGVHAMVATPGRLVDFLDGGAYSLAKCCYLCLDEGDRMLDLGFDEDVKRIINHFPPTERQTLLFSATFPQKFRDFARTALFGPIVVNVSRAGAANLDVLQEVEVVRPEARIVYLLECLQKTAPPVVVFCERKADVDDIHEYLLLKGVAAASIHGSKNQADRNDAIRDFKSGKKDVLVATDVAAKGLDFPDIQHVVNFDMPSEIENYVHRIGRTGRCGKTGVATTFISKTTDPTALRDLKSLLVEARQRVPPVLQILDDDDDDDDHLRLRGGDHHPREACPFCGGLGHRITECPKRDKDARRLASTRKDLISGSGGYGGDW
ncbi:hypothetical protein CTAYLR_006272 [Chrysophaeum taylorii]|uniref:RNA helicase n=1 Tax=Chrysophaeum taylorii TaxID=2483200 RepID=A0AAD7XQ02_9STRA|nr:hypothetical protein CTAYLR_006272 [Chrysophaeum taylorii]